LGLTCLHRQITVGGYRPLLALHFVHSCLKVSTVYLSLNNVVFILQEPRPVVVVSVGHLVCNITAR
jgi:hypothetical protein